MCFFPGSCDISSLVGLIDLHQDACHSQQLALFLCEHKNKILQVDNVIICFFKSCSSLTHAGGGISSYADQQGAAGQSLEVCLDQAVKDIPKERHQLTPVYLGATAGMRLLQ